MKNEGKEIRMRSGFKKRKSKKKSNVKLGKEMKICIGLKKKKKKQDGSRRKYENEKKKRCERKKKKEKKKKGNKKKRK